MEALLYPAILLAHAALVAVIGVRVVMLRALPSTALAWILLVAILPLAGFLLYLAFGERRVGGRHARRLAERREPHAAYLRQMRDLPAAEVDWSSMSSSAVDLDCIGRHNMAIPTLAGNSLELLVGADDGLQALVEAADGARSSLHLEFYIWHPGGQADEVASAVERAAGRGVRCRIMVDALGSSHWLRSEWPSRLRAAGVDVVAAMPAGGLGLLFQRNDLRNHRKIVVVDGELAFTGSMNLVDPRFFKQDAGVGEWIDALVRVRGPAVAGLLGTALGDWFLETETSAAELIAGSDFKAVPPAGSAAVQVVASGPAVGGDGLVQMLLTLLHAARERITITTPYFVPDEPTIRALRTAAARGVEVNLVVPERVDSMLVRYASRSYFADLMASGVRIHAFRGGLLHTKSITVDGALAMFGTHNIDFRSLWLNFEVSLFVYDRGFAGELEALQRGYLADCVEVDPSSWGQRRWRTRFGENLVRLFSPLL